MKHARKYEKIERFTKGAVLTATINNTTTSVDHAALRKAERRAN